MDRMKGVVLTGHGGLEMLEWREDLPRPVPGPGEVLIRLGGAAVNNTDVNTRLAWYSKGDGAAADATWTGKPLQFPHIQGADGCGEVVGVGPGTDTALIGKRVLIEPCLREVAGQPVEPFWYLGSEVPGTFAEYVAVAARHAHVVESDLSDVELASFACSYSTAENMIVRSGARSGERALVTGASGGVGSAAVQLLAARGVEVTVATSPAKADALRDLGAAACLMRDDVPAACSFDVVIDLVGGPNWPRLIEALKPGGRYAVAGAVAGAEVSLDLRDLYLKDLSLLGCTRLEEGIFAGLVRWIESGKIKPLLAACFDLRDIRAAQIAFLERDHVGKIGIAIRAEARDAPRTERDGGFTPNADSLAKARELAEALGLPFSEAAIAADAAELHGIYFRKICEIVGLPTGTAPTFVHGDFRLLGAFADSEAGRVRFDQQLDHWFMGVCHTVYCTAAFDLDWEEYATLADTYDDFLDWTINPYLLERKRDDHWTYFLRFAKAWHVAHPLSRAMTIFVICHELAHIVLKHSTDAADKRTQEFEADALAARYFLRIVGQGAAAGVVCVDPKLVCAPLLIMRLFEAERLKHGHDYTKGDHPEPLARLDALRDILRKDMSNAALTMEEGMLHGFEMLDDKLRRRREDQAMHDETSVLVVVRSGTVPKEEVTDRIDAAGTDHGLTSAPGPEPKELGFAEAIDVTSMLLSGAGGVVVGLVANTIHDNLKSLYSSLRKGRATEDTVELFDPETGLRVTITRTVKKEG